jgi:hypothetical protein
MILIRGSQPPWPGGAHEDLPAKATVHLTSALIG